MEYKQRSQQLYLFSLQELTDKSTCGLRFARGLYTNRLALRLWKPGNLNTAYNAILSTLGSGGNQDVQTGPSRVLSRLQGSQTLELSSVLEQNIKYPDKADNNDNAHNDENDGNITWWF